MASILSQPQSEKISSTTVQLQETINNDTKYQCNHDKYPHPTKLSSSHAFFVGDRSSASIVPSSSLLSISSLAALFSPRRIRPTAPSLAGPGPAVIGLFKNSEKLTLGPVVDIALPGTPAARSGVGKYGLDLLYMK